MILIDVNVLIYAFRADTDEHRDYLRWLREALSSHEPAGVSDLILSGVVRVVTHPRVFAKPTPPSAAFEFANALRSQPNVVVIHPGGRHWEIFESLCTLAGAKGNLVSDAYHAALAIEHGCELVTTDRDYSRFPGLRYRHPLG